MATDDLDANEFLQDLQFLIATDDQLNDDLSLVCDLLSETSPGPDADSSSSISDAMIAHPTNRLCSTAKLSHRRSIPSDLSRGKPSVSIEYPPTGAKNRFQYRQRHEIRLLREQVDALKKTLAAATSNAVVPRLPSVWKRAADQERLACKRAVEENVALMHAVGDQATFIEHMQQVFAKKPRVTAVVATEADVWQSCKLAAHRSLRVAAIHAIADRQLGRMQSALIRAGVFNEPNDKYFASAQPVADNLLIINFVNHVRVPAPHRTVSASCWQVLSEATDPSLPDEATEVCEVVDSRTVYRQFSQVMGDTRAYSNVIRKYYPDQDDQDVIVWRNVLEDALAPHLARGAIDNEWGWLVVAPIADDPTSCRVTFLHQVLAERDLRHCPPGATAIDVTTLAIHQFRFCERPAAPGRFSGTPADVMDTADNAMKVFMSKGKRLELALCTAVDNALAVAQINRRQV